MGNQCCELTLSDEFWFNRHITCILVRRNIKIYWVALHRYTIAEKKNVKNLLSLNPSTLKAITEEIIIKRFDSTCATLTSKTMYLCIVQKLSRAQILWLVFWISLFKPNGIVIQYYVIIKIWRNVRCSTHVMISCKHRDINTTTKLWRYRVLKSFIHIGKNNVLSFCYIHPGARCQM